jgi:aryl-alcohol dehydrogenase-like predicted oxidoreductase
MIEGSGREYVGRGVRKPQDVDEVLVETAKGVEPSASSQVVQGQVDTKATGHEKIVRAIHRERREVREWIQLFMIHRPTPLLVVA